MKREAKAKQIVVRFDSTSYAKINDYANIEHRGLGEFVRHATLYYMEHLDKLNNSSEKKAGRGNEAI